MNSNLYNIEMFDIVKEIKANLVIKYHSATITLEEEHLKLMRENGFPTDVMSCIYAGFIFSGKNKDYINSFMDEAKSCKAGLSIEFVAPDGGMIDIKSKMDNPKFDQLIQLFEDNRG